MRKEGISNLKLKKMQSVMIEESLVVVIVFEGDFGGKL